MPLAWGLPGMGLTTWGTGSDREWPHECGRTQGLLGLAGLSTPLPHSVRYAGNCSVKLAPLLSRFPWKGLLMEAAILPPPGHQPDPQCIQAKIQRGSLSTRPAEAPPPASTPNPVCPVPLDHRRPRSWGICRAFSDPKPFPFSGGGAGTQSPFC